MQKAILGLIVSLIASACSSNTVPTAAEISPSDSPTNQKLLSHYNQWRGVSYREGGLSKSGIDCSGFVHLAYKQALQKSIPRTTDSLSRHGRAIESRQLRPGDLVFFKTGWKKRHVGIYVGNGEFIHASTSRGVILSRLDNPYWSDAWWMARRY